MPKQDDSNWSKFAGAGMEVAAGIGLGTAVGFWVDKKWHTNPYGVLIGITVGFATGMYLLIKAAIKANKD